MDPINFRPGSEADSFTAYRLFKLSFADFARRSGLSDQRPEEDEADARDTWPERRSLFDHLARTADRFVVAEVDGEPIGYARSILRGGTRQLTDFFVLPGRQSVGVGRELLARAFPQEGAAHRTILATSDPRALARYLKAGVYARFPVYNFSREPRDLPIQPGLDYLPVTGKPEDFAALNSIDRQVLGFTREVDHAWWLQNRFGFFYYRGSRLIGYGYTGYDGGPFALLDNSDFPAILAHAEHVASQQFDRFHIEVPLINRIAVDYLLAQRYVMEPFIALFMSEAPFGMFENYILPAPPFFL